MSVVFNEILNSYYKISNISRVFLCTVTFVEWSNSFGKQSILWQCSGPSQYLLCEKSGGYDPQTPKIDANREKNLRVSYTYNHGCSTWPSSCQT